MAPKRKSGTGKKPRGCRLKCLPLIFFEHRDETFQMKVTNWNQTVKQILTLVCQREEIEMNKLALYYDGKALPPQKIFCLCIGSNSSPTIVLKKRGSKGTNSVKSVVLPRRAENNTFLLLTYGSL